MTDGAEAPKHGAQLHKESIFVGCVLVWTTGAGFGEDRVRDPRVMVRVRVRDEASEHTPGTRGVI